MVGWNWKAFYLYLKRTDTHFQPCSSFPKRPSRSMTWIVSYWPLAILTLPWLIFSNHPLSFLYLSPPLTLLLLKLPVYFLYGETTLNSCLYWLFHFLDMYSSVQSFKHVRVFVTPWAAAHQASLSITNSQSLPKLMSIESVMPSNHLILCHPIPLLPSVFPSIRVFSNEPALHIRWPKYSSFSFNISPSNEHPGLISFRMDWLDPVPCSQRDSQESSLTP